MVNEVRGAGIHGIQAYCWAAVLLLLALVALLLGIVCFLLSIRAGVLFGVLGLACVFCSGVILLFLINNSHLKTTLEINSQAVRFERKDIRGTRQWREPLNNYKGLQFRRSVVFLGGGRLSGIRKTYWVIDLVHQDRKRTVTLVLLTNLKDVTMAIVEQKLQSLSDLLKLPVLNVI
jgi:hypothetical protein